jgi:hypothetical protein
MSDTFLFYQTISNINHTLDLSELRRLALEQAAILYF